MDPETPAAHPLVVDLAALLGGEIAWEPFREGVDIFRVYGAAGASPASLKRRDGESR